jgi:hypothetical protein
VGIVVKGKRQTKRNDIDEKESTTSRETSASTDKIESREKMSGTSSLGGGMVWHATVYMFSFLLQQCNKSADRHPETYRATH